MIKRRIVLSLIVVLAFVLQSFVFAEPSGWAVEIVESSIGESLVPTQLQNEYQKDVTRSEYVLLALRVLEQNGVEVVISNPTPFTDISGHVYETEIIRAFNANIVGGYNDNTFRPDQPIKREEVAALVYNLVKTIKPDTELPSVYSTYSDGDKISSWAKGFVEFNHAQGIMSGTGSVGGYDTINPQGQTTREQAIILLYKVSKKDALLHSAYVTIETIGMTETKSSAEVFETAQNLGFSTMDEAIKIVAGSTAEFLFMNEKDFTIIYPDGSSIEVMASKYDGDVAVKIKELTNTQLLEDYMTILNASKPSNGFATIFNAVINEFKTNAGYVLNDTLSSGDVFTAYSESDNDVLYYFVKYTKNN